MGLAFIKGIENMINISGFIFKDNGNDIEANKTVFIFFIGGEYFSGPEDFALFALVNKLFGESELVGASAFDFNKTKGIVFDGDEVDFGAADPVIGIEDLVSLVFQVPGSGGFAFRAT